MATRRMTLWAALMTMVAVLGCTAGISSQARSQVTFLEPFGELLQNSERYIGETVLLGGRIIETVVEEGVTELTMLQLELDRWDQPLDSDRSSGRFLVRSQQFLDPALYPDGTTITVVGRFVEIQERLIGNMPYQYPVIIPIEIKKWPAAYPDRGPRFFFGIGIGTRF